MGSTLFGGVESGTPLETRGGTSDLAKIFQSILRGDTQTLRNATRGTSRLTADAISDIFGGDLAIGDVATDLLADPADATRGLFAALRPFEERSIADASAGTRSMFGTVGGRFGRNVGNAEARVRSELGGEFARTRSGALLDANAQRLNALNAILGAAQNSAQLSMMPLQMASQFFMPGAPIQTEGLLGPLIGAAGNIYASRLFSGGRQAPPQTTTQAPGFPGQFGPAGPYTPMPGYDPRWGFGR